MDWDGVHFWAKTTKDGQPGISVRDHCLNAGCVAEALILLPNIVLPFVEPFANFQNSWRGSFLIAALIFGNVFMTAF